MPDRKRIITIGGTFLAIAGIGFFMQNGQSGPSQAALNQAASTPIEVIDLSTAELTASDTLGTSDATPPPAAAPSDTETRPETAPEETAAIDTPAEIARSEPAEDDPVIPKPVPTSAQDTAGQTGFESAALDTPVITVAPEPAKTVEGAARGSGDMQTCAPEMKLETMAAALVNVVIHAECLPNERVSLEHAGMVFSEATDTEGKLEVTIPALAEDARITATFPDDHTVSASATVSSLEFYDRAVIQSTSDGAVTLHALEYGAGYTDRGHVWSEAAGGIENAATGKGGFLITLGNPSMDSARIAQVYTFPTGIAQESGQVELSVEIEVTDRNCGRPVDAQALQTGAAGALNTKSLNLTMPDCDAIGDLLVLKNLVNDLKVARN